ncbi:ATPase family associated with various cellular activities (AAA) domain-containing protein [Sarocladium implicatum]|nr:ATPase family associated with various cellular activities (AAA) domain-containing protein [Sarocladium implicatum]
MATNTQATSLTSLKGSMPANPANEDSQAPAENKNTEDGTKREGASGEAEVVDRKADDSKGRLNGKAKVSIPSNSQKAHKARHKPKVIKATPPTGDSDESDSTADDSDNISNAQSSDSDSDSDSSEPSSKKKSHAKRLKDKSKEKHRKLKKGKVRTADTRPRDSPGKAQSLRHKSKGSDSTSESDSDSAPDSSDATTFSSRSSSEAARKDKKRNKSMKILRGRDAVDGTLLEAADTNDQIRNLQFQVAQLTQQISSLQQNTQGSTQVSALGLGGQSQMPFQMPQNTVLPGTTPSYNFPHLAETNVVETPFSARLRSARNLPQDRGRRGRTLLDFASLAPSENLADAGQISDSLGSLRNLRKGHKTKKGTRADYKRVDWVWDTALYTWKLRDSTESTSDAQYDEYIFHVRRSFDIEGKYRSTTVDIKSKLLRECLQDVIGDIKGVSLVDESPKTDPNMLFLYLEDLRAHRKNLKAMQPAGETKKERKRNQRRLDNKRKQLKVLIAYLDKDYARTKESLYPMLENGLITFDLMWALWKPGTLAYSTTYGSTDDPRVFKVELAERHKSFMRGELYHLDGKYFEFDGKKFGHGSVSDEILAFRGARKITSLPCYPLKYHPDEKKLRGRLIERGKKFVSLSGVHYKGYSGMAYQKSKKCVVKFNIQQSRIMVDPAIFRRINPNYYISPVKAPDESLLFGSDLSDGGGETEDPISDSSGAVAIRMTRAIARRKIVAALKGGNSQATESDASLELGAPEAGLVNGDDTCDAHAATENGTPVFSDDDYMMASPVVLGFSFAEKQWLEFTVEGVKEIVWNDTAWDSLVSEPETKDLVQALVKSRKYHAANTIDDVIQGKGKGLVTVLHGPPGTGKTLTAEGISELLKCPLYMASAGELGTDSRYLEAELQKILDICHAWGAILLLDEADVFLEKRNMLDIHRNALVSIFLRQLEYFQGILFLTTNRVETFDEAFQSRIHIALRYGTLEPKAKRAIFSMFIEKVRSFGKMEVATFTEAELDSLARKELNGREIKNVVSSAQDLAVSKEEALSMTHIQQVLDVHAKFGRDLKGGSGFEDAMRSYF